MQRDSFRLLAQVAHQSFDFKGRVSRTGNGGLAQLGLDARAGKV